MFTFKSYSWVIGTTSFRVKEVNYKIEEQLRTLKQLFAEHPGAHWENNNELQAAYYDKLHSKGLIIGEARNKAKDARQKTSVLKELGLVTEQRNITEVGGEILRLVEQDQLAETNDFMIDTDALVYLKQFLKVYVRNQDFDIKPFVALLYFLDKLDFLTEEEFTYFLPICRNKDDVKQMVYNIRQFRSGHVSIGHILLSFMDRMDNYTGAMHYFMNVPEVTSGVMCEIGMNRKSRDLDEPYYHLYKELIEITDPVDLSVAKLKRILQCTSRLSGKAGVRWKALLFGKSLSSGKQMEYFKQHYSLLGLDSATETLFRRSFFQHMHLIKWKLNLEEYADLNRRFFSLADIVSFHNDRTELTLYAKYYFHLCIDELLEEPNDPSLLEQNLSFAEISPALRIKTEDVVELVSKETGKLLDIPSMRNHFRNEKEKRLHRLIKEKFTRKKLIEILDWIERRDDQKIQDYVTDNADVPTIFEYVLGVCWYHISGQSINLLESWNMSLDAALLPKRHAGGGGADIVIRYPQTISYPEHNLLLEATLTSRTNQRRAEMEPVSRHLGTLKAQAPGIETYCVFSANHLDANVIIDLRGRKYMPFQDYATGTWVRDNKIIPLNTANIKAMLEKKLTYEQAYQLFEEAYHSDVEYESWYEETINKPLTM